MIDTDKYEGHTPGPWRPIQLNSNYCWTVGNLGVQWKEADKQLIADAPLLLAEVKRLTALADALFDLIPSHLSTEATDIWNEHMGGEEE